MMGGGDDGREGQGSAEGYLFCLAALLNTELPLPKETEHKTQHRNMCVCVCVCVCVCACVWPAYQRGPAPPHCTDDISMVSALHSPKSSLSLSARVNECVSPCVCRRVCVPCFQTTRISDFRLHTVQLAADKGVHRALFQRCGREGV